MFDKDKYWENRKSGKRGQENDTPASKYDKPAEVSMGFNNDGEIVVKSRAYRRQRFVLPGQVSATKSKKNKRKKK